MSASILQFPCCPKRSIIVEQLNPDQWHAFTQGADDELRSEYRSITGAVSVVEATGRACEWRELTGLPVLIQPMPQRRQIGGGA